ncbi:MAG: ADP-ribosylation factor-like protein [Promethearchaeota archaeon]
MSYFDQYRGPRVFCALPSPLEEGIAEEIRRTLDFINRNFFAQYFGSYSVAHRFFKVKSKLGRGRSELLLLSLVFPPEAQGDPTTFLESMEMLTQTLSSIENFYLAFHEDVTSEELINKQTKVNFQITQILGQFIQSFPARIVSAEHKAFTIVFFCLKDSGKKTIANQIRKGLLLSARQTTRRNILRLVQENAEIVCYDSPREDEFSKLSWKRSLTYASILAFVLDVSKEDTFKDAYFALWSVIEDELSKGIPLAILANKVDLIGATNLTKLTKALQLNKIRDRPTALFFVSGKDRTGLEEAFEWISDRILER